MAVNNETGAIQPLDEISKLCKEHDVVLHCDAVQAIGHGLKELLRLPDLLSLSAHKFGGPRGAGALIQRALRLPAVVCGGPQEHGCRAGTENLPGVVGLVAALEICSNEVSQEIEELRHHLERELQKMAPTNVHAAETRRAPHITSVAFPGRLGRHIQQDLDRNGIAVGLGSACTGCENRVSHVLEAMQVPPSLAEATVRFSFGWSSRRGDIDCLLDSLQPLVSNNTNKTTVRSGI